ncbi:MAG: hypothetical protein ACE5DN_08035 [Flavobacteriales bacterium]
MKFRLFFLLFLLSLNGTLQAQLDIYGIDILRDKLTKKELRAWQPGPKPDVLKRTVPDENSPLAIVLKYPGREYHFKTDRGNYNNMPERFRQVYKYLQAKFGEPGLLDTPEGTMTNIELKRYPDGTIYFFTHKWDFDKQQYYADRGDTLTAANVYERIVGYREWITIEWTSMQKFGIIIRLRWKRTGINIQTLNFNAPSGDKK